MHAWVASRGFSLNAALHRSQAGAITTVFLWITEIDANEEQAAALTTLIAFWSGYFTPSE